MQKKIVFGLLLIFLAKESISKDIYEKGLFTPEGAYEIRQHKLEGRVEQLSYFVQKNYPLYALTPHDLARLEKEGWRICENEREMKWNQFVDQNNRHVFSAVRNFWKKNVYVKVMMRYVSPTNDSSSQSGELPGKVQDVNILFYDLRDDNVKEQLHIFLEQCKNR